MAVPTPQMSFAFVFPMASGHINPSLPVARGLVGLGHRVHYVCATQMREAIQDTGAEFHSALDCQPELYQGREPDPFGALASLRKEHGCDQEDLVLSRYKLANVQLEIQLEGMLRFLRKTDASAVVFCPFFNRDAAVAARVLGIPAIAMITVAGPGCCERMLPERLAPLGLTPEGLDGIVKAFQPNLDAVQRIHAKFGVALDLGLSVPYGKLDSISMGSSISLVTTCEDLCEPMSLGLGQAYKADGVVFEAVGPLLDQVGAVRAGVFRNKEEERVASADAAGPGAEGIVAQVRAARGLGRTVVLVSMGTVVTGDLPVYGWTGRPTGSDGKPRGLTGRELCRAAWGGAFDAFGAAEADKGALVVVGLGPQSDALGDVTAPPNALCAPSVPQVDILKEGVDIFLTHGGQNSFTESLAHATPVVVCPGFGDQVLNSHKAVALGVGLKVDRPDPDSGDEAAAAQRFRADVRQALLCVASDGKFKDTAERYAEKLRHAGGVPRSIQLVLEAASAGAAARTPSMPMARRAGA